MKICFREVFASIALNHRFNWRSQTAPL